MPQQTRSSQARGATARQAPDAGVIPATHRSAGLVRPPSPQVCRGARRPASAPILTGSGCPKSCCSRPRSRRSRPITRVFWRAGTMSARSPRRRSTMCSKPGPGSAITRAPATCMPAPAPWSSATAANFRQAKTELRTLPGIGDYTAAAIAAIAYDLPATPVDGNIERVVARLYAVETPLPAAKPEIRRLAAGLTPQHRAGDFAQAMMDLGATICTPKNPACALCPWNDACAALRARRCGDFAAPDAETRRRAAPRRGLCRAPRRRHGVGADAAGERAARRHDRSADDGVAARFRRRQSAHRRAAFCVNENAKAHSVA